jgi:uncharacterized protein involved in exopolysaccharide biosynthesis
MAAEFDRKRETTIRDFLNVVFRRKAMIIAIVLIATAVVAYLNTRQPTVYESRSRILIKRGELSNVFSGTIRYMPWEEELSSLLELILSDEVFSRAKVILADSSRASGVAMRGSFRSGNVGAEVIGESNVIVLNYTAPDPQFARQGCAAVTKSFQEYFRKRTAPPPLSDYFAGEIQDVRTELDFWREKKNEFLNQEMFFGADEEGRFLLTKLTNLEMHLNEINNDYSSQQIAVEHLRILTSLSPEELESRVSFTVSGNYVQSGIITNLKIGLQSLRMKREALLNEYTPKHPKVISIDNQITETQSVLKEEIWNYFNLELSKLQEIAERKSGTERELRKVRDKMNAIPDKDNELKRIESKIEMIRLKYETLLKKQDEAEIALASTPEWEITILTPAGKAFPQKTKDYIRIALGPFFSFIIALGLAFFFESLDHTLRNVAEVEEYLKVPVLATISEMREKR